MNAKEISEITNNIKKARQEVEAERNRLNEEQRRKSFKEGEEDAQRYLDQTILPCILSTARLGRNETRHYYEGNGAFNEGRMFKAAKLLREKGYIVYTGTKHERERDICDNLCDYVYHNIVVSW